MAGSFFGTDGIRGRTTLDDFSEEQAIELFEHERTITPAFIQILGEALALAQSAMPGEGTTVVVGWDRRPHNEELASALTLGLRLCGCEVLHIGECATPTLHLAVLNFKARMGCMITASHNPVSDSGVKIFNTHGYKISPKLELDISQTLRQLAAEDREVDANERLALSSPCRVELNWPNTAHRSWLEQRWSIFESEFGRFDPLESMTALATPFLIDSAGGSARTWLAPCLSQLGIACREVSLEVQELNRSCGAGEISPTQTWTHEQASREDHILLRQLSPAKEGTLVGAMLDGDGDRCLVIQATSQGYRVIDGDAIAAILVAASQQDAWHVVASIESDIGLTEHLQRLKSQIITEETAVGDRWLSFALRPRSNDLLVGHFMPGALGIEDSGHVVLPSPHPQLAQHWSLVGDGAATLCAVLLAYDDHHLDAYFRGWKKRISLNNSHRERWHEQSELFAHVEKMVTQRMAEEGLKVKQRTIDGEENLLLVHGQNSNGIVSFAVRNSGTQEKTNLSLRLSRDIALEPFQSLLSEVEAFLRPQLCEN